MRHFIFTVRPKTSQQEVSNISKNAKDPTRILFFLNISKCFSYNPDLASDPCAEDGCLWFFNFFVYNKKMKRIVFFSCRCTSKSIDSNLDDDEDVNDDLILEENSYDETAASRFYSAVSNISTTSTASVAVAAVFTSSGETIIG